MGLLASAMLTEISKESPEIYCVLEVSFPDVTRRYAETGVASVSQGLYKGRVLRWDTLPLGVEPRTCGLETVDFSVDIEDTDRDFSNLVIGLSGHLVRGSAFTLKLASPNVAQASWFTLFAGVLYDFEQPSANVWTLRFRPNDIALERPYPKVGAIGLTDWPNSSRDARGRIPSLTYGKVTSNGNKGAIDCPLVDIAGCRYMVCVGYAKAVDAVFKDGAPVTSGYSITHPVVNGRTYTLIVFTSSQGESVITADIQGYETVGDGSGTLIENQAEQLQHFLINWVWGDYKTGSWLSVGSYPIDTTYFSLAATFLSDRGHKGSRVLGGGAGQVQGLSTLEEWCSSLQCQPFWMNSGKLAIRFENPMATPYPTTTIAYERDWIAFGPLSYNAQDLMDRLNVNYLYDNVGGQYTQALEVRDPNLSHEMPDHLDMPWAYGSVT